MIKHLSVPLVALWTLRKTHSTVTLTTTSSLAICCLLAFFPPPKSCHSEATIGFVGSKPMRLPPIPLPFHWQRLTTLVLEAAWAPWVMERDKSGQWKAKGNLKSSMCKLRSLKGLISTCNLIRLPQQLQIFPIFPVLGILGILHNRIMQSYVLGRAFARLASDNTRGLNARKTPQFAGKGSGCFRDEPSNICLCRDPPCWWKENSRKHTCLVSNSS